MVGAFSRKRSGISCDLTAFRKIKELRANAVETPLGVTGLLAINRFAVSIGDNLQSKRRFKQFLVRVRGLRLLHIQYDFL